MTKYLIVLCFSHLVPPVSMGEMPLPEFKFQAIALHPKDLNYAPTDQLIHPSIIKTEGRIKNPLGAYYMYYAPHKHIAISMAYADSLEGPWKEYVHNPVLKGPSAPDIRWIKEKQKFYMWGHTKNSKTDLWTSEDGITFNFHSVSVKASEIGTRNATYSRVYEYSLKKHDTKYIMLYTGFIEEKKIRCIWLAISKDAEKWTQIKTPLITPILNEKNDLYGPSLFIWHNKNYVLYQDHTTWRGGNIKYVEVDSDFSPVDEKANRYILMDPDPGPPLEDRYRGAEIFKENGQLYLYSSAAKDPRVIVYAKPGH